MMNGNQAFISQWSKPHMQVPLPFSEVQKPYDFYRDSVKRLGNSFEQTTGSKWAGPQVMVTDDMMKRRQDAIAKENDYDDARFATEQAKLQKELIYKGMKSWSRFYSKNKVTPETIATDIGTSAFQHTRNSVPTGDSPQINGSEVTARTTEQVENKDEKVGAQQKGLLKSEYMTQQLVRPIDNIQQQKLTQKNYDSFL